MKRKFLKSLPIFILLSFGYADAMNFGNKFMSHFARIGLVTKKPVTKALLSRPCSYLKNDAIAQSKKFNSVKPSLYLGASIGTAYLFNERYLKKHINNNPLTYKDLPTKSEIPQHIEPQPVVYAGPIKVPTEEKPSINDIDEFAAETLRAFLDETNDYGYAQFRDAILWFSEPFQGNAETKKIIEICNDFDEKLAKQQPNDLIWRLYLEVTFDNLPEKMSAVAVSRRNQFEGKYIRRYDLAYAYAEKMALKIANEKNSNLD
ncbi:hypothetical protein HYX58_05515 [Candidatus Dependentiae bacterium]|nr:hypothetical protein [Candidatus Dependentiae bacterium]